MAKKKAAAKKTAEYDWIAEGLWPLAVPVDQVKLNPRNARKHDDDNLKSIAASLRKFGQREPLVANELTNEILTGNGRYLAATKILKWSHLAILWVKDDPATATGFAVADNRTAELAEWDDGLLDELLGEIQDSDPGLYDDLLLVELQAEEEEPAGGAIVQSVPERFEVVIECADEDDQKTTFDRLEREGRKCRLLTL